MQSIPLWEINTNLPVEVGELTPQFRKRLGWKESNMHQSGISQTYLLPSCLFGFSKTPTLVNNLDVWRSRSLKITDEAKRQLFSSAKIWALQVRIVGYRYLCHRFDFASCRRQRLRVNKGSERV